MNPDNDPEYINWLLERSMLHNARTLAKRYVGQGRFWNNPYANARPRAALTIASVWFTAYPASIITHDDESVLAVLGKADLWHNLSSIGVQGIHTGPMKRGGGIQGRTYTPTIDGHFDRIGFDIDPAFGTQEEFINMSRTTAAHNAVVIDDIIPAHTGKGADFLLAERAYGDHPGLYHMVSIDEKDWSLLPPVKPGRQTVNLTPDIVDQLRDKGYIVGQLRRVIFFEPGVKDTDWSATDVVVGVDGIARRWVYLHYFKEGQPSLNWLDPSFAAPQTIIGDALHSIDILGARGLRLDANGFLGIERMDVGPAWSEGHPLSVVGNQLIGGMIRKAGAFSFQELNLTVDDMALMSKGGADLSYDFVNRPAYHHAILTGNTEFLRLMLRIMHQCQVDPASLVHALQNHDELTLELVHFWSSHANDTYTLEGKCWQGHALRDYLRNTLYEKLTGEHAPYNLRFVTNGVACTTVSVLTAALGISDLETITDEQKVLICRMHLLLAMFNAFQPGVFALSGWDFVGALPLPASSVASMMSDGDTRWIERGAYDLVNVAPEATTSKTGVPRARALYGPINEQLKDPNSFASQLKSLLAVRQAYNIHLSRQIAIPDVSSPSLLLMVHELPDEKGIQITALNFGRDPIEETVSLKGVPPGPVVDMVHETIIGDLSAEGIFVLKLEGYQGLSLRVVGGIST